MYHVERWVRHVANQLHRRKLLASAGGPVILVQLENEYQMVSDAYAALGTAYLQWMADLQQQLQFGVPAIMCYGAADGVVETINSFYAHRHIAEHRRRHPDQPPVWTECWTGWYDVWGAPHHRRPLHDLLYSVARFFAAGGAGINYYMWMGGTNFGRTPMYLQATSYDYDAPIDEFGFHTTKSRHLALLHSLLKEGFETHFMNNRQLDPPMLNGVVQWGHVLFICNDSEQRKTDITLPSGARYPHQLSARSVHIVHASSMQLLFDTSTTRPELVVSKKFVHVRAIPSRWKLVSEPVPTWRSLGNTDTRDVVSSDVPHEQLALTGDHSDYAFYVARFERCGKAAQSITLRFEAADFVRVFIDGRPLATSHLPLWEDRWRNKWAQYPDGERGTAHALTVPDIYQQAFELCVMVNALGLVKGDWQLNNENMACERKGLLSDVQADGWQRCSQWRCAGKLAGELRDYVNQWHAIDSTQIRENCPAELPAWCTCVVKVKPSDSWVLDLLGFGKGVLWVNGHLLGRFWDIKGTRGIHGFLTGSPIVQDEAGTCTQRYYHVPKWVLSESNSDEDVLRITMFLEAGLHDMPPLKLMEAKVYATTPIEGELVDVH
eukprot:TRINITY_DN5387_c0_g1_i2.p1 TRINITY_DN5387_c0_g1~~TRINITY_DN5387_c0_g1_i2.p1  ORF type:complete len:606 (+),score=72.96 TRINITY_DN5387_c0_g1_i2:280-2097(+)